MKESIAILKHSFRTANKKVLHLGWPWRDSAWNLLGSNATGGSSYRAGHEWGESGPFLMSRV